jgi:hypothetical protein
MAKNDDKEHQSIRLPPPALEDLAELARHQSHLMPIARESASQRPAASVLALSAQVSEKTGIAVGIVQGLGMALWNLKTLQGDLGLNGKSMVGLITRSLERTAKADWKSENFEHWKQAADEVAKTLDLIDADHPLMISAKAGTLAYTHQNLWMNARLITDVRPVFDTAGNKIVETVITHSLVVNYADGTGDRRLIALALDQSDILDLRRQCDRAELKARVTVDALKSLNPVLLPEGPSK